MGGNLPVLRPVPADESPLHRDASNVVERFRLRVDLSVTVHA
ncbi:MAG: hypothetical protein BIFFINMI_03729 [Phycisphaerae bacterium]|nr:hypothetical protein [Phycisphaerae bacterium]